MSLLKRSGSQLLTAAVRSLFVFATLVSATLVFAVIGCEQITGGSGNSSQTKPEYGISLSNSGTYIFTTAIGENYAVPAALGVVIANEGRKSTGGLTVALSGANTDAFTLSDTAISSISVNGTGGFSVAPIAELAIGTYTATVTVASADIGISLLLGSSAFNVSFTVTPDASTHVYGIALSETGTYIFPPARLGYEEVSARSITVTNIGNQPTGSLTLAVSASDSWTLSAGTLSSIEAGETGTFTVEPAIGLPAQTHNAIVTVSGHNDIEDIERVFNISFTVNPDGTIYSIGLSETGTYTFPPEAEGYAAAPTARNIIVTNIGTEPTGPLAIEVSDDESWELSSTLIDGGIEAGKTTSFTIAPETGLSVQTHNAVVTVRGLHELSAHFSVVFTVTPNPSIPVYNFVLSETGTCIFPSATVGTVPSARNITVTNIGNQPTGSLTAKLSGTDGGSFILGNSTAGSNLTINSIAAGGSGSFTIKPKTELAAKTYNAVVTVSGHNDIEDIERVFNISFTVNPDTSVYSIGLSETGTYNFPPAPVGYTTAPSARTVTVSNTGNQPTGSLTAKLSGTDGGSFILGNSAAGSNLTINSIAAGVNGTFTIKPVTGLTVKTYNAVVTVSGGNGIVSRTFSVSFTVNAVTPVYSIGLSETGTYNFPSAIEGDPVPSARTVTVTNTGNQPTGSLTVAVSDTDSWTLSAGTLGSIAAGQQRTFTIKPNTGLAAKTYNAVVTVGGTSVVSRTFSVSFTVTQAIYSIVLSKTGTYNFPSKDEGYTAAPNALTVTVSNTGNKPTGSLTVAVSDTDSWTLSAGTLGSIAINDSSSFTIEPVTGLSAETHNAVVTVGGGNGIASQSFNVSFTVNSVPVYGINLLSGSDTVNDSTILPFPGIVPAAYGATEQQNIARKIQILNTGNQPTGYFDVGLSGTDPEAFNLALDEALSPTVSTIQIGSIEAAGTADFWVAPALGLPPKTYSATLTVNSKGYPFPTKSFTVTVTVYTATTIQGLHEAMAADQYAGETSGTYTMLPGSTDTCTGPLRLATEEYSSPETLTIDGGGMVIYGDGGDIILGRNGITLHLKNFIFVNFGTIRPDCDGTLSGLGFDDPNAAGGTVSGSARSLVLNTGGTVSGSAGAGLVVNGRSFEIENIVISDRADAGVIIENGGSLKMNAGAVVRNNGGAGVTVNGGSLVMNAGAVVQGNTEAGVTVSGDSSLVMNTGALVSGNTGSGVLLNGTAASVFTMSGGTISGNGNTNSISGGVRIDAGEFTMNGGTISGNTAGNFEGALYGGGGVALTGANTKFTMTNGEISGHNHDGIYGVGLGVLLYGAGSEFNMSGGTISDNHADSLGQGGGVAVYGAYSGKFYMSGGTISGNSAHNGGGVYVFSNAVFKMTGGEITGNSTPPAGVGGGVGIEHASSLDADGKIKGDPQIGGDTAPADGRGWIYDNWYHDVLWP